MTSDQALAHEGDTGSSEVDGSIPPARHWLMLTLLTAVSAVNLLDRQIVAVLIQPIKRDLQLSDSQLGILTGLGFAIVYALLSFPAGMIADRVNRSRMIAAATLVWSVMCGLCGLAGNFLHLILARFGVAVGEAGALPPTHSLIAQCYPPHRRAFAISVVQIGAPLGLMLAFGVGGAFAERFDWRTVFFLASLPGLLVAIACFFFLTEPKRVVVPRPQGNARVGVWIELLALLRIPVLRLTVLAGSCCAFASYATVTWLVALIEREYGWSTARAGAVVGPIFGLLGIAGTLAGGYLGAHFERRRPGGQLSVVSVALILAIIAMVVALSGVSSAIFLLCISLAAPTISSFQGPLAAAVQNAAPETSRALAAAFWVFSVNLIGIGLGPTIVGLASDLLEGSAGQHSLRLAMLAAPASLVIGVLALRRAARLARI